MIILITVFFFVFLKLILIILYFLLFGLSLGLFNCAKNTCKSSCKVNIKQKCNEVCSFFHAIFKKIYTYNFYSYENRWLGFFLVSNFALFIFFNVFYICLYLSHLEGQADNFILELSRFYAFETHIFIELYCACFFVFMSKTRNFIITIFFFLILNIMSMYSSIIILYSFMLCVLYNC